MSNEPTNPSSNSSSNPTTAFDRALVDEPGYAVALEELLGAIDQGGGSVYDRVARRHPRYAAPLLEAALIALPADRRLNAALASGQPAPASVVATVNAGIDSALKRLGLDALGAAAETEAVTFSAQTLSEARKTRGWTLAEVARRLHVSNTFAQKLLGGQIATWSARLTRAVAETYETTREAAEAMLAASAAAGPRQSAAAYSAEGGDPQAALVAANQAEPLDFETEIARELASGRLTPEQAAHWEQ